MLELKPKVVITNWVHPAVVETLSRDFEVVPNLSQNSLPRSEVLARASDAQALMAFMPDQVDAAFLRACPKLKIVAAALKGYDNFDVTACTQAGVWLTIVPDLLTVPTAELAIGLLLSLTRQLKAGDDFVRSGAFQGWRPQLYGTGLQGKTLGVLGMGAVGQALTQRLGGFDMKLTYYDPIPLDEQKAKALQTTWLPMAELLAGSDIVVPLLPLTSETLHLFNSKNIAKLKPGAILINVSRGSVVDEEAVAAALATGQLAGYAADVFELEDWARTDRPQTIAPALLSDLKHTFFTPHLGSAVDEVRLAIEMEAAHSIREALQGGTPRNAINQPTSKK